MKNGRSAKKRGTAKREIARELTDAANGQKERIIMPAISEVRSYENGIFGNDSLAYKGFTMPLFPLFFSRVGRPAFRQ